MALGRQRGDGVLIVWVDLQPHARREANRWYTEEHLPERVEHAGYLSARRYRAVHDAAASPMYMAVFEAVTPDALASEGYRRLTSRINPWSHAMRGAFERCIRSTHRRLASFGGGEGGVVVCARLRFADAGQRAAFEAWARRDFAGWLSADRNVIAGHALTGAPEVRRHMDSFRETGHADEWADGVLLAEVNDEDEAEAVRGMFSAQRLAEAGVRLEAAETGTYRWMAGFARP